MALESDILQWLFNQGVAVFFGGYILIRIEAKLDKLIAKIEELCKAYNTLP